MQNGLGKGGGGGGGADGWRWVSGEGGRERKKTLHTLGGKGKGRVANDGWVRRSTC